MPDTPQPQYITGEPVLFGTSDVLHPTVQLRLGDSKDRAFHQNINVRNEAYYGKAIQADYTNFEQSYILTVPPENLLEFTNVSERGGAYNVTISFIDPTFGDLEQQFFKVDRYYGGRILYRWGYPGNGLESSKWNKMVLQELLPTISSSGIRITIVGVAKGSEYASFVEPKVYRGKISTVVRQIAKEMGYNETDIYIEETNDDKRDEEPKPEWPTNHKSRVELIRKLLPKAKSKTNNQGNYDFTISSDGTFHFHTEFFKLNLQDKLGSSDPIKDKKIRQFNVLFGIPTGVISFNPAYSGAGIGAMANECMACIYDPRTKQYNQSSINRKTMNMTTSYDTKGSQTTSPQYSNPNDDQIDQRKKANAYASVPVRQVSQSGHCSGRAIQSTSEKDDALNYIQSAWKRLQCNVYGGVLELVGLPEYCDFDSLEYFCDVLVYLPQNAKSLPGQDLFAGKSTLHWSSGRYVIDKVTHRITHDYRITVELRKNTSTEGIADATTHPQQQKPASK